MSIKHFDLRPQNLPRWIRTRSRSSISTRGNWPSIRLERRNITLTSAESQQQQRAEHVEAQSTNKTTIRLVPSRPQEERSTQKRVSARAAHAIDLPFTSSSKKRLIISVDGQPVHFDTVFLRDSCPCALCVDPSTRQKLFQTAEIPAQIQALKSTVTDDGRLRIRWLHDIPGYPANHVTEFEPDFLRQYADPRRIAFSRFNAQHQILWDRKIMESDVRWIGFEEYMASDEAVFEALRQLSRYGLVFIADVPADEKSAERIGMRVGPLMDTFYGRTWDVKSVVDAKNIA